MIDQNIISRIVHREFDNCRTSGWDQCGLQALGRQVHQVPFAIYPIEDFSNHMEIKDQVGSAIPTYSRTVSPTFTSMPSVSVRAAMAVSGFVVRRARKSYQISFKHPSNGGFERGTILATFQTGETNDHHPRRFSPHDRKGRCDCKT